MSNTLGTFCPDCGHSLEDNNHGPDQNDYDYDVQLDRIFYSGSCTYCKICQKLSVDKNILVEGNNNG